MNSGMDEVIRDLTEAHGHENVTDDGIREIRSTLSHDYLDNMLDSSQQDGGENHNDGKTECS